MRSCAAAAIVFAAAEIGDGAILGDQSFVRERARMGDGSVVGRGSAIDNDVLIGARVRIQTDVYITAFSVIEDDVFVGPGVARPTTRRWRATPRTTRSTARYLRRACRVGGGVTLCPGVEVGEEAFVGAGRGGDPLDAGARRGHAACPPGSIRSVGDEDLLEHWR